MEAVSTIRIIAFLGIFTLMALWEAYKPAHNASIPRAERWRANLSLVILGAIISRILLPASLLGVSLWAADQHIGLLNVIDTPSWLAIVVSVLILDVVIYWQHRLFHRIPLLWRVHKMHHADSHVDTTTGLRFHPIEIGISLLIKATVVVALGAPLLAIVVFEVLLNGFSLFNHANIRLPKKWDKRLALVVVTQRIHRIHHSQRMDESNSNFGFSVTWWDRLFGSYKSKAKDSDENLTVGLSAYPVTSSNASLLTLLKMPFDKVDE